MNVEHMYYVHPIGSRSREAGTINFVLARRMVAEATLEAWAEDRRFTYTDMYVRN